MIPAAIHRRSLLHRSASFTIVVLCALVAATPSFAQGTSGQVPDPMSSSELARLMAEYVHPTKEQSEALEALHNSYRERFRALRENEIERYLEKTKQMQGNTVPRKEQMEEFRKGYERVNKQIAEVDDSLFEAVAALVGEAKRPAVLRARDARSRTRSGTGMSSGFGSLVPAVDLSAIVFELGLTPDEMAKIDPTMVEYERMLTASLKEIGQSSVQMIVDLVDEMNKAGLGDLSQEEMMKDPEKMKAVMETVQSAMAKAGERLKAKSLKLAAFNAKTCRALADQLEGDSRRKLRMRYVAKAYPELGGDLNSANTLFKRALRIKKLDDAARGQIQAAYDAWQAADEAYLEQCIKEVDDARAARTMGDFAGNVDQYKKMAERTEKRREIGSKALKSVAPLIENPKLKALFEANAGGVSDELVDSIDDEAAEAEGAAPPSARATDADAPTPFQRSAIVERGPIGDEVVESIAAQLALDDSGKALLRSMHDDYAKKWNEEIRAEHERVDAMNAGRWEKAAQSGNLGAMSIDPAQQDAYYKSRAETIAKAVAADEAFLADLAAVLGEKSEQTLEIVRLERVLDRSLGNNPVMAGLSAMMGAPESPVNIVTVLRQAKLPPAEQAKVNEVLAAQAAPLAKAQMESLQAGMELEREMEELSVRSAAAYSGKDGEKPDMAAMQKLGMEMMELQSRSAAVKAKRTAAVQAAWKAALAALDEPHREALQLEYDRTAYPAIFKDKRSALPFIEKALAMGDLTDAQRQQLRDLQESVRKEHLDFCRRMVPAAPAAAPPGKPEEMAKYWQERMAERNAREKIRFERDEQSQRAVSALRRILTEAQVQRIQGIADYEQTAVKSKPSPFGVE
jgi:hypothetical protein